MRLAAMRPSAPVPKAGSIGHATSTICLLYANRLQSPTWQLYDSIGFRVWNTAWSETGPVGRPVVTRSFWPLWVDRDLGQRACVLVV